MAGEAVGLRDEVDSLLVPREWQARQVTIDGETEIVTGPIGEVQNHRDLLIKFGYNPDDYEITGAVNQWRKERADGQWLTSYFFKVKPLERKIDLPALYQEARRVKRLPLSRVQGTRCRCPVLRPANREDGPPRWNTRAAATAGRETTGLRGLYETQRL
jgi:hypothetical protein